VRKALDLQPHLHPPRRGKGCALFQFLLRASETQCIDASDLFDSPLLWCSPLLLLTLFDPSYTATMNALLPSKPALGLSFLMPSWTQLAPMVVRRHQSSYQRTRKRLTIKPHSSFLTSKSEREDHIVFNPPASAPSVYHTPTKFMPPSDRRRVLFGTTTSIDPCGPQPPPVRPPYQKKYHLREADLEEMRKLRKEDPYTWTRSKLAKKFDCSTLFVGLVCQADTKFRALHQQVQDIVKSHWGTKRRIAREDRVRRRELWGRDA
jgi:hypothetical protein